MMYRNAIIVAAIIVFCFPASRIFAQGPEKSFFYSPLTELPWCSCHFYFENGSKRKLPFLPVIDRRSRSPLGSCAYTKDISVDGPVFFAGNGIVKQDYWDCYDGADVTGKVVLFCYDSPDSITRYAGDVSLERRISEAVSRGAIAVVLFSVFEQCPFLGCQFPANYIPAIPVITLSEHDAQTLIETTLPYSQVKEGRRHSADLVVRLSLHIESRFDSIDSDYFTIRFPKDFTLAAEMQELTEINRKAIDFILDLFKHHGQDGVSWQKTSVTYFSNYDSKIFFTAHWGSGLSSPEAGGVFSVYKGASTDYALAVHENTHSLCYSRWGSEGSCSFMDEGIAKFVEAESSDRDANHLKTLHFMATAELPSLEKLTSMEIGSDKLTHIGYPASGSFAGFVVSRYSMHTFEKAYKTSTDNWDAIFAKSMDKLESEWLFWLADKYGWDRAVVEKYESGKKR